MKTTETIQVNEIKPKRNSTNATDHLFKIVLIGDSGVGKSSILLRFADGIFSDNYISTVGVDFRFKTVDVYSQSVRLQIWDTAGQERFRTIISSYYRGADCVIFVYDITNADSFEHVADWYKEVTSYVSENTLFAIIGNKNDLANQKEIAEETEEIYAKQINALYTEASAKNADHVDSFFITIAQTLVERKQNRQKEKAITKIEKELEQDKIIHLKAIDPSYVNEVKSKCKC
ncbi:hypothetical protein WA158_002850 [Blastocystis sp. Blastoise]